MKILAFSDIHGHVHNLQKLESHIANVSHAIFLGDGIGTLEILDQSLNKKIIAVKGNCDLFCPLPTEQLLTLENKKIFITHGHTYNVKLNANEIVKRKNELNADIVLYGHTHKFSQNGNIVNVPSLKDGQFVQITLGKDIKIELKHV